MSANTPMGFGTASVHAGQHPDRESGAHVPPLHLTSTFVFTPERTERWLQDDKEGIYFYTRMGNPTQHDFEEKLAALEGGEQALVTGSGMAAVTLAVLGCCGAGDDVLSIRSVYGGTYYLFTRTFPRLNLGVTFVDPEEFHPAALEAHLKPNTKVLFFETIHNPCLQLLDMKPLIDWAHTRGLRVIVDNTFATPYLCKPLELGADLVVHSTTKYLNGHGDHVGGALVGGRALMNPIATTLYQDLGPVPSPFQCWLGLRGSKTLHVRMRAHCENALQFAQWLEGRPEVVQVLYPGLPSHPHHALAQKYLHGGFGGMVSVEVKGGQDAALRLVNSLQLAANAVSLGDVSTLVQHPASMTHARVAPEERARMGIGDGMIRISIGIEDVEDLVADFTQAFAQTYTHEAV